jgi:hypothetical protein
VSDRRKPTAGTLAALPFPGAGGPEPAVVTTRIAAGCHRGERWQPRSPQVLDLSALLTRQLSGAISQATWHLAPGSYELFCSMPGHLAHGMHTILRVR